jgi:glyoxylase-like metal-dependent hydrolase (beta-lactamase superfamily II)/8-oxo-dGTP pyrophosphatase MutT (NUDIX family)
MTSGIVGQARLRPAAAVVLVRGAEFFWVRRSAELRAGGGFHAFPGGGVEAADRALAARECAASGADLDETSLRVAAVRELFEETGVLLACGELRPQAQRDALRRALLAGEASFHEVLTACEATLELASLAAAGRWVTPAFVRQRFDARFYIAALPPGQETQIWPGELVDGAWTTPAAALELWERGAALLHPPALHVIRCLHAPGWPACADALLQPIGVRAHVPQVLEFQGGIRFVPLRTPTLPPAQHTHAYLLGDTELLLVDPGAHDADEQALLFEVCDALQAAGRRVREILLTHEHLDHIGTAGALRARLGVPLRAHALTARRLPEGLCVDSFVAHDERWELRGRPDQSWRALHTPGHARGHLCLFEERTRALIAGDMLAGEGTVVVPAPPEGDMGDYVASLERLAALEPSVIYPAHGPVIVDGRTRIRVYIEHRAERERAVMAALCDSGRSRPEALVARVYRDVDPAAHTLAVHSLRAVLDKLVKQGQASHDTGDGTYMATA